MKAQIVKGMRDLGPEDAILLEEVVSILRRNFSLFGFNPIQTPSLEMMEVLSSKYAGGAEILKETYTLTDQGKRKLALRYDLTVPFARFVAMNKQLKMPFKRYQIGRVFRDGPIKANRYREFTQCDCDVVGTGSIVADAECVQLFLQSFKDLNIPVVVKVNNRKILDALMDTFGIVEKLRGGVILAIDKMEKKSRKDVAAEITALGVSAKAVDGLFDAFGRKGSNVSLLKSLGEIVGKENEGIVEMKELLSLCPGKEVVFTPSLARGLSYYTGTIFEVFVADGSISSSIGSGGRYDKMIGDLVGGKQAYPAVGCSFGLDVVINALKLKRMLVQKTVTKVYVVPIGIAVAEVWDTVLALRRAGVATDVSFGRKGLSKNLDYVDKYGIPYVVLIGEDELAKKKVTLRNMASGKESLLSVSGVVKKVL